MADVCPCATCHELDREYPGEGVQLALVNEFGGELPPAPSFHPDTPATPLAGDRAPEGRICRDACARPTTDRSHPAMNQIATLEKPARTKGDAADTPVPPSTLTTIAYRHLRRAPENVRHTSPDEDVEGLAADIAAHGLLQSLIGYREGRGKTVWIVGGGRRLQALARLVDDFRIDLDFPVPVLIRDKAEAIELSLSENLARRNMNPADEFLAFSALMAPGTSSPADLAKRFGFTERYVKQRLRLASLAPEILDGLRERKLTLDAALAYARAADPDTQRQIYKAQDKRGYDRHSPAAIRHSVDMEAKTTNWPLYRYVGAEAYERAGGEYDEGLFDDHDPGDQRKLASPATVLRLAADHIDFQMVGRLAEFARDRQCDTADGFVRYADLLIPSWNLQTPKPPEGFAWVEQPYNPQAVERMWNTVRNNRIRVQLLVGINSDAELVAYSRGFFVEKSQKNAVQAEVQATPSRPLTQAEIDEQNRGRGIELWSKRLAVGPFGGTPLDGRAIWLAGYDGLPRSYVRDGVKGWLVPVHVFVTEEEVAAQVERAGDRYEQAERERAEVAEATRKAKEEREAAAEARLAELRAMDPPAVIVIDGEAWARDDDGAYAPLGEEEDGYTENWQQLLDWHDVENIDHVYDERAEYDAAMAAARANDGGDA